MEKKSKPYMRKEKIVISDIMYEILTSPLLQEIYGTNDPGEIAVKIFENHMKEKIKRGDFEGILGNEEIYKAFDITPESKSKTLSK